MKTWADAAFRIGSSHEVCEDYAMARTGNRPAVALSDGCSGAENTDLGARALVLASFQSGDTFYGCALRAESILTFSGMEFKKAEEAILATLLTCAYGDGKFFVKACGDGLVGCQDAAGWGAVTLSPQVVNGSERPYYPAYLLRHDGPRFGMHWQPSLGDPGPGLDLDRPFTVDYARQPGVSHAFIASDGWTTFYEVAARKPVPVSEVLDEFFPFKLGGPAFVRRRMSAFKRRCAKLGWDHYDDISIAAIRTEDE